MSVAGAYWRGNEKNKQLTRVYGISFPKQKDLTDYLTLLEEAKKLVMQLNRSELAQFRLWFKQYDSDCRIER